MKRTLAILALSLALLLASCAGPGQGVEDLVATQPAETSEPTTESTPALTEAAATPEGQTPTGSKATGEAQTGAPAWDAAAEQVIISVTNCCGFITPIASANSLPNATIYGDGRTVWTQVSSEGQRQVLQGQLSAEQLTEILTGASEAGFFEWDELYTDPQSPTDLPTKCIAIQLSGRGRRVCEYYQGAPEAFTQLYQQLSAGAGLSGEPYIPERGFLTAVPVPSGATGDAPDTLTWDPAQTGLSLADAAAGVWVEGAALQRAWEIVNANPWGGFVLEGGTYYEISLQIPGLSINPPPAQP